MRERQPPTKRRNERRCLTGNRLFALQSKVVWIILSFGARGKLYFPNRRRRRRSRSDTQTYTQQPYNTYRESERERERARHDSSNKRKMSLKCGRERGREEY